jgi:hypothetical protein
MADEQAMPRAWPDEFGVGVPSGSALAIECCSLNWGAWRMVGWMIYLSRLKDGGASPGTMQSEKGASLATWQTPAEGLRWIDELVKSGGITQLGGDGYPYRYTAPAASLLPLIENGPPKANTTWTVGEGDVLDGAWSGKTLLHRDAMAECRAEEWLLIEAWDES